MQVIEATACSASGRQAARTLCSALIALIAGAAMPACLAVGGLGEEYTELELGRKTAAVMQWEERAYVTFVVDVPRDAMVLVVEVEDSQVDLDIFARFGEPMASYEEDIEFQAPSWRYNDTLRITRHETPALQAGTYFIDVAYNLDVDPEVESERVTRLPFSVTASVIRSRVDARLVPGEPLSSQTDEGSGWFRTFTVEVPESAENLRIDLSGVKGDLDVSAKHGGPVVDLEQADHVAESLVGRESLRVGRESDPPLVPGTWYVNVYDPYGLDPVSFTAHAGFATMPAAELLALPDISAPDAGIGRALLATVELLAEDGGGSGTLISPEGWVLTNHHVIELGTGDPVAQGEVVISLCLDSRAPPVELFRGSVVVSDPELDLALVKIESGLYGQPLPAGFTFPYLELGDTDSIEIGDPVSLLGFPSVGGMGSRATVSLTRGVISGFDTAEGGLMFKTDAEIAAGNSGGAALDRDWRLIGVPVGVLEAVEGYSQLGYILPVSRMAADWREQIGR